MNGAAKIQASHWQRQAILYLRQSSPKQVLQHKESALNQKALSERLLELGWHQQQITVIDEDQGLSAKQATGRQGFQRLVADVSLGQVGIVMGYEVSRLSRSCADWHRLVELCSLFDTLIGDSDGLYNPRDFNDRLLLGLKGTMSEAELHSLRLRLDAGRLSKAKRGELIQHLPTGYVRTGHEGVVLDPDTSVQERIRLVFQVFMELGSVQKVLRYFARHQLKLPRHQTSGLYAGEVLWKEPAIAAMHSILKNPAYAGAFVYGRRIVAPLKQIPGRPATGRPRQPQSRWLALVKDAYPAYISWEQYEQIQQKIAENNQKVQERLTRKGAVRQGLALLGGLACCSHCGHRMHVAYKNRRFQYICQFSQIRYGKEFCQYVGGNPVDAAVTQEFFQVLHEAQIDALARVAEKQQEHHAQLLKHLAKEVERCQYAARRAERQYNCVDPENRLIAASLEKKWETTLRELEQARGQLVGARAALPVSVAIPPELREAFADVGKRLPEIWPRLSPQARKALIRTLIERVNLCKASDGQLQIRIAWRGGLASEVTIRVPLQSRRYSEMEQRVVYEIQQAAARGHGDQSIAEQLNRQGLFPCRGARFTAAVVQNLRLRYRTFAPLAVVRRGNLPAHYTFRELSHEIPCSQNWFYQAISRGNLEIDKDATYGCYLLPREPGVVERLRQLYQHQIDKLSFRKEHYDG